MQSDKNLYSKKVMPSPYEVGTYAYNVSGASGLDMTGAMPVPTKPLCGVELQALEMCPKNFIIFDQTDDKSRIMFHPALVERFRYPGFDPNVAIGTVNYNSNEAVSLREDSKDIDALLSFEDEDDEDEEVSTGRTMGDYGSNSPDSYSTASSRPHKIRLSSTQKSFPCTSAGSSNSEKKKQRMKKMMNALRGIVPGVDGMDTVTVLDEAVRYLKSLKVEVKRLGIGNLNN